MISETKVWGKAEETRDFFYQLIETETIQDDEKEMSWTEEDTILKSSIHKREMFKEE
jgi:hypothetical protein